MVVAFAIPRCRAGRSCRSATRSASARARASSAGTFAIHVRNRRQRADREQRAGQEPRHDRDRGTRAMYSSCFGTRLASVSAPRTSHREQDGRGEEPADPGVLALKSIPRATPRPSGRRSGTRRPPARPRGCRTPATIGGSAPPAGRVARPASRSTITPIPANMQLIGMSSPIVPIATKASIVDTARVCSGVIKRGCDDRREQDRRDQRYEDLARRARVSWTPAPSERCEAPSDRCARCAIRGRARETAW